MTKVASSNEGSRNAIRPIPEGSGFGVYEVLLTRFGVEFWEFRADVL